MVDVKVPVATPVAGHVVVRSSSSLCLFGSLY